MVENDPLAKAEALLARYRTVVEPSQMSADFPVLTEIVESPPQSSGRDPATVQEISSPGPVSPAEPESGKPPPSLMHPREGRLDSDFRRKLADDLAKRIEPAISAFASKLAGRLADEIASSVTQEVSRQLLGAMAEHRTDTRIYDEPAAPIPPA